MSHNRIAAQTLESAGEKIARMMTSSGTRVVFTNQVNGPCADINTNVIMTPPLPEKLSADAIQKLHGIMDHEAAHLIYTKRTDGTRPNKSPGVRGMIENALEDGRINRLMCERYIGSRDNLLDLTKITMRKGREMIDEKEIDPNTPDFQIAMALCKASYRDVWGNEEAANALDDFGDEILATMPDDLREQLQAIETYEDVDAAVEPTLDWIKSELPPAPSESEPGKDDGEGEGEGGESDEDSDSSKGEKSKSKSSDEDSGDKEDESDADGDEKDDEDSGADGEGDSEEEEEGKEKGTDEGGDDSDDEERDSDEGNSAESDEDDLGAGADPEDKYSDRVMKSAASILKSIEEAARESVFEDIKDAPYTSYWPDTTLDREIHIRDHAADMQRKKPRDAEKAISIGRSEIFHGYRDKVAAMRTRLVMDLQSKGKVWVRDQHRGRSLDTTRLHRPSVGDSRVFKTKLKHDKINTAVTLLIDCSGSMGMKGGVKFKAAMQLAALFCESLEMAGVPCEILGFTTAAGAVETGIRMTPLQRYIFKGWDETMMANRHLWPTVGISMRENVDGESVMWAAKRLANRTEERKVLLVLSDGQPACGVRDPRGFEVLYSHLKEVVKKIESAGIEVLGIGIQTESVRRFYRSHAVYRDLDDLLKGFYKAVSRLLKGERIA